LCDPSAAILLPASAPYNTRVGHLTGTLFLAELERRARQNERLYLLEAAVFPFFFGLLAGMHFDEYWLLTIGGWGAAWLRAVLGALGGAGLAAALFYPLRSWCRDYASAVLLDGGLLGRVLDPEWPECWQGLRFRAAEKNRQNPARDASFSERITLLLAHYPRLAGRAGYLPFPGAFSRLRSGVQMAQIALSGASLIAIYCNANYGKSITTLLQVWLVAMILLNLVRMQATAAARSGLALAVAGALYDAEAPALTTLLLGPDGQPQHSVPAADEADTGW
jgi:hypothetical protein